MEVAGALGFPVPRPQPLRLRPRIQPGIAEGLLETILIEVTRPAPEGFMVRIFDEDHTPPAEDVVCAYVFYGVTVATVARRLEEAWSVLNLRPVPGVRTAAERSYLHGRGHPAVVASIEALQESSLP